MKECKTIQEYVYPAVFHANEDGTYTIIFPDLPGCISEGKSLGNAMKMAEAALTQWIEYLNDSKENIPVPSKLQDVKLENNEFVNFIRADIKDSRAVKRTISLPRWMDEQAAEEGLSLSKILQEALSKRFIPAN
ncbi:type II toxin-antitoxin system HicB family antitoxin [Phascolarctobacterium sp.]|uniref:type II toxin-antitoxin system HicB family antitoxin n=1 Tax=Phascolarctobacterium sp. TaxID=2049039 RepID=UPI0025DF3C84|nr:type II toxin-antitoxin system HicB family antitoxin [Phascolarctobacterium sp.]